MKISLKWLNDYVDVQDYFSRPEELGEILTRAGLEVEEMTNRSKDFQNVVVGLILEKGQHPNADKLSLCRVSTGEGQVHQIVCGAQNHKTGDRVIVALPGAILPGNFAIKKSAIRGVESLGMLCSLKELGLAQESHGIEILPVDAPVGKAYAEFGGYDDVTFELKVTPNRADCLSHFGLAREVSCLLGRQLKDSNFEFKKSQFSTKDLIHVDVRDVNLSPRYTGRVIKNIQVKASPAWLRQRIESVGLNSINNIVDITNFVMMELGQPLHAFDLNHIQGGKVIVDRAQVNEKMISLDGTELTLKGEELTIRDQNGPMCVAGVIGGKDSGVSEKTTDLFLESAYFLPMSVRKASRGLGVETDSAYRFSRGVDPDGSLRALHRATQLIVENAGGEASVDHYDFYPSPVIKKPVVMSIDFVSQRLGYEAKKEQFLDYMKRLGCQVKELSQNQLEILPPTFRFDLEIDMDFVEEYARLNGYEFIPESLPQVDVEPSQHDLQYLLQQKTARLMIGSGYQQAFNYAFVSEQKEKSFLGHLDKLPHAGMIMRSQSVKVLNPLNEELNVMRSSIVFGLYQNMLTNFHHGNLSGRLFEIGRVFQRQDERYVEQNRLALCSWGQLDNLWQKGGQLPLVFELKSVIEKLLKQFNITAFTWNELEVEQIPDFAHQGQFAQLVVEGKKIGFVSTLHPNYSMDAKIRVPVAFAEVDFDMLMKGQPRPYRIQSVCKLPIVERDFAFVMNENVKVGDLLKEAKKQAGSLFYAIDVFDIYQGDKLESGHKSVAVRLSLQDKNATLQDAQILEVQKKVLDALSKNFGAVIR